MTTATTENFALNNFTAVDFLASEGRTILLNDVSWNEYEMFLKDFEERAGWRLAYDGGRLEIMPPTYEHEYYSFSFHDSVRACCDELDLELVGARSTTFRSKSLKKGSSLMNVTTFKTPDERLKRIFQQKIILCLTSPSRLT